MVREEESEGTEGLRDHDVTNGGGEQDVAVEGRDGGKAKRGWEGGKHTHSLLFFQNYQVFPVKFWKK